MAGKRIKTTGKKKVAKKEPKQKELPGTPKPNLDHLDSAQKAAMKIIEANDLIKEGHEQRKEASEELSARLTSMGRDRTSVMGKTFILVHKSEETRIKIINFNKEKKD